MPPDSHSLTPEAELLPDAPLFKSALIERAAVNKAERTASFVASDETPDRLGDIVRASGWELDAFRTNPIMLFGHDTHAPIGTVPNVRVRGTRLLADVKFAPEGASPIADTTWALVDAGVLKAVSVGFRPIERVMMTDPEDGSFLGWQFTKQELLELSIVAVPANPNALSLAKELGLSDELQRRLFTGYRSPAAEIGKRQVAGARLALLSLGDTGDQRPR